MGRHGVKTLEVMLPLLDRGETAAHRTVSAVADQRGSQSGFVARVFGAVFIAGQVVAVAVTEAFSHLHQTQGRCQRGFKGFAAIEQFATIRTVQPAPQRLLCRRVVDAHAGQRREHAQAFDVALQRLDQGLTETDHRRFAVHPLQQFIQRRRQFSGGLQGEEHMTGLRRNWGGENARLVMTHMNSLIKSAKFNRSTDRCVLRGQKSHFKIRANRSTLEAQDPDPRPSILPVATRMT
ncbi:hypothetical protein D3C87_1299160 [compost metagenome]